MARISYLSNDGFLVETRDNIIVFDPSHDPGRTIIKALERNPEKPVVFLVSCRENFNHRIFNLGQNHRRAYILSNDIELRGADDKDPIQGMSGSDIVNDVYGLRIQAFKCNAGGVAYVVTTAEGETYLHTGNMQPLPDIEGDIHRTAYKIDEMIRDQRLRREDEHDRAEFETDVRRIAAEYPRVDVVFADIDRRSGRDGLDGFRFIVSAIRAEYYVPMHFRGDDKKELNSLRDDMKAVLGDAETKVLYLHTPDHFTHVDLAETVAKN